MQNRRSGEEKNVEETISPKISIDFFINSDSNLTLTQNAYSKTNPNSNPNSNPKKSDWKMHG